MAVNPISSPLETLLGTGTGETQKKEETLNRDSFLKMLIAQLEHQDPLNPMEGTDFSSQLAQFSSLEQLFNMNEHLSSITDTLGDKANENVLDFIGKEIISEDNTLKMKDGKVYGGAYTLEAPADLVLTIYDASGREVIRLYPGETDAGTHPVPWSGNDATGETVPDGTYHFELSAVGDGGVYLPVQATLSGTVTGVTYREGDPYLEVGGALIDPDTVTKVWDASQG